MAATKKTTKKAATKRAAKKASTKITLADSTLYVLSVRNKLFFWTPQAVYETYDEANRAKQQLEADSILAMDAAKVTRVKLVR